MFVKVEERAKEWGVSEEERERNGDLNKQVSDPKSSTGNPACSEH